jgi:formimidoylglutamate deiminase
VNDPSVAGSSPENLLTNVVFSLSRTAVRDVVVGGRRIVADGRHAQQEAIVRSFAELQQGV